MLEDTACFSRLGAAMSTTAQGSACIAETLLWSKAFPPGDRIGTCTRGGLRRSDTGSKQLERSAPHPNETAHRRAIGWRSA